jgi:hypothetical protein
MRLLGLSEFVSSVASTPIGLAYILHVVTRCRDLTSRISRHCLFPKPLSIGKHPLSGFNSSSEYEPMHGRKESQGLPWKQSAPSEVSTPCSVSQHQGATRSDAFPMRRFSYVLRFSQPLDVLLPLAPSGLVSSRFRSWGYPFEALILPAMPYALSSTASPHRVGIHRMSLNQRSSRPR